MIIERNEKEILIRLSPETNTSDLQDLIDYLEYKELVSRSNAMKSDIDQLADEVDAKIWERIKKERSLG